MHKHVKQRKYSATQTDWNTMPSHSRNNRNRNAKSFYTVFQNCYQFFFQRPFAPQNLGKLLIPTGARHDFGVRINGIYLWCERSWLWNMQKPLSNTSSYVSLTCKFLTKYITQMRSFRHTLKHAEKQGLITITSYNNLYRILYWGTVRYVARQTYDKFKMS